MGWTGQNVIANQVIIEGANGLQLVYSGTAALGNLIASTAGANGADGFGNAYLVGDTVYGQFGSFYVALQMEAGQLFILQATGPGGPYAQISSIGNIVAGSVVGKLLIQALSHTYIHLTGNSVLVGGTSATSPATSALFEVQGNVAVDSLAAITAGVEETWHTPTPGSNWASGPFSGGGQGVRYRLTADGMLEIIGAVHSTSNTPAGTVFTLPSGWQPSLAQNAGVVQNLGGTITAINVNISTGGAVVPSPAIGAADTDIYFTIRVPMS